jgi:chromosome segregation and condensation protein ScpB
MTTEKIIEILTLFKRTNLFVPAKYLTSRIDANERQLRKLVEQIRTEDLAKGYVLISSDKGYKLSNNPEEISQFLNRYLSAAYTQIKVAKSAKRFLTEQQTQEIQLKLEI